MKEQEEKPKETPVEARKIYLFVQIQNPTSVVRKASGKNLLRFNMIWGFRLSGETFDNCLYSLHKGCTAEYGADGLLSWSFCRNFRNVGGKVKGYPTGTPSAKLYELVEKKLLEDPVTVAILEKSKPTYLVEAIALEEESFAD